LVGPVVLVGVDVVVGDGLVVGSGQDRDGVGGDDDEHGGVCVGATDAEVA